MGRGRRYLPQGHVEPSIYGPSFTQLLVENNDTTERVSSHEKRRAQQDEYRKALNMQVADLTERRENDARRLQELEQKDDLKSVSLMHVIISTQSSEFGSQRG